MSLRIANAKILVEPVSRKIVAQPPASSLPPSHARPFDLFRSGSIERGVASQRHDVDAFERPAPQGRSQLPYELQLQNPPRLTTGELRQLSRAASGPVSAGINRAIASGASDAAVVRAAREAAIDAVPFNLRTIAAAAAQAEANAVASSARRRPGVENQQRYGDHPRSGESRAIVDLQREPLLSEVSRHDEGLQQQGYSGEALHVARGAFYAEALQRAGYSEPDARAAAAQATRPINLRDP